MYIDEIIGQLHPGFIVRTNLDNSRDFHYNIIQSIYGNTLVLSNYKQSSDLLGQDIVIKANTPSAEYVLFANILDTNNSSPPTIKVSLSKCIKQDEKRRYERYLIKFGSNIKVGSDKIGVFSLVSNISFTGAYVEIPLDFPVHSPIKLDLISEGNEKISTFNALINRKILLDDNFGYGLIFSNNNETAINKLSTILQSADKFKFELYEQWQRNSVFQKHHNELEVRALIVDDIKLTRISIKNIFNNIGILNTLEASNGSDAIKKIEAFHPDIVTLDISMPVLNGIETVKHISGSFPLDKIIIISAFIDNESMTILKKLGITKFVLKPFSETQIVEEIKKIFPEVIQC